MATDFGFAIDRGGTFTDIYCEYKDELGEKRSKVHKLLSEDPENYKDAPTEGIRQILESVTQIPHPKEMPVDSSRLKWIRMGTTVATNALLERKGEKVALLITKGFKDLLIIGNQSRSDIFALNIKRPLPIYSEVLEVNERVILDKTGDIVGRTGDQLRIEQPLDLERLHSELLLLKDKGISSLAVCLAHSYTFPDHEMAIEELAKSLSFSQISLSSVLTPKIKMLPRASTACVDAYLTPKIKQYIEGFRSGFSDNLAKASVLFMQSDGGLVPMDDFVGSKSILSGPAGGVVGFAQTAEPPLVGFDMGGTSTDVSRYDGQLELVFESEIAGVHLMTPQLDISTVAAGGGSRLFFRSGLYVVGPESSGAHPGPLCYRKNGFLSITDANLVLGRIIVDYFPKIFGPNEDLPLDLEASTQGLQEVTGEINAFSQSNLTIEEVAYGFIKVANESMCRPIRALTEARGFSPAKHTLACFGGAGGQHACAIARNLGMTKIVVHKHSGILSAYGLGLADIVSQQTAPCMQELSPDLLSGHIRPLLDTLRGKVQQKLLDEGLPSEQIELFEYLHLRFTGTDTALPVLTKEKCSDILADFFDIYKREFGFVLNQREVIVDEVRVRGIGKSGLIQMPDLPISQEAQADTYSSVWLEHNGQLEKVETPVYAMEKLSPQQSIPGPAILLNATSTVLIEFDCTASVTAQGNIEITLQKPPEQSISTVKDPILLSVFAHRFMSIAEQMGKTLQRTSVSTNIKERLDYSCAIFGPGGDLVANAPHLPVHLGSMQEAVKAQISILGEDWKEGDVLMSNHPSAGGSHLPDITVITPVFSLSSPVFYVASRGHHADIGGITPGSMPPFSKTLAEEGVAVESFCLVREGVFKEEKTRELFRESRCLEDNISDLKAQIAANNKGIGLLNGLIEEYSLTVVQQYMRYIQEAASQSVQDLLGNIKAPKLKATEFLDDGTPISLEVTVNERTAVFDFTGTGHQVLGNLNSPPAVVKSAVLYCLRCMVNIDIPLNQGCLDPITIIVPPSSILSPSKDAAVVGGNVLTSQRVTDVILKAFGACAASQGCMNNLTFGNESFGFYETIAGGSGAGADWVGTSGVHTHMTNTRITDIEIMERRYPVLIRIFGLRGNSGGEGKNRGGDGVIRQFEILDGIQVSILSERRAFRPYGIEGGGAGKAGLNLWMRADGTVINVGGKNSFLASKGDQVRIETPGGGGYGE